MTTLVGIPTYDDTLRSGLALSLLTEMRLPDCPAYTVACKQASLLALAHNELLCIALNNRPEIDKLLIVHNDILPDHGYLAQMHKDMRQSGADVLGAVIPIKDSKGLTSTALLPRLGDEHDMQGRKEFRRRRLTIKEAARLPDIFDAHDLNHLFGEETTEPILLVNTGMLLIDVTKPFVEKVHFEINDEIFRHDDSGQFYADVEPEDWFFSRQCAARGARICVTRRVHLRHVGRANFPNTGDWGEWDNDQTWPGNRLLVTQRENGNGQYEPEWTKQKEGTL